MSFIQTILASESENAKAIEFISSNFKNKLEALDKELIDSLSKIYDQDIISPVLKTIISTGRNDLLEIMIKNDAVQILIQDSNYLKIAFDNCRSKGHTECIKLLIKSGSPIGTLTKLDFCVAVFIQRYFGMKVNKPEILSNPSQWSSHHTMNDSLIDFFCKSIVENNEELFKNMVSCVKINELTKSDKSTPIMYAAQEGRFSMMKTLLEKGASVAINTGRSALYYAVCGSFNLNYSHFKCIKLLLNAGSDIEILKSDPQKYFLIKLVKELIENKKNELIRPSSVQPTSLLITELSAEPNKKIYALFGENKVRLLNETFQTVSSISSENMCIEKTDISGRCYLLPIGTIVNGKKIDVSVPCIFTTLQARPL